MGKYTIFGIIFSNDMKKHFLSKKASERSRFEQVPYNFQEGKALFMTK